MRLIGHLVVVVFTTIIKICEGINLKPGGPYNTFGEPKEGMLNVHLVSHSHDDLGWIKTVKEYYTGEGHFTPASVRQILNSVTTSLSENKDRKFIQVEMGFFDMWWREQSEAMKARVRDFVKNEQFVFINGGWVMNDEATPTFLDVFDQHTLGALYIAKLFGTKHVPQVGWQIDPFGHSAFQATAFNRMGMNSWFFARIDFEEHEYRKAKHLLETIDYDIMSGMLANHYSAPDGFVWGTTPWRPKAPDIVDSGSSPNVKERIDAFVKLCNDQAAKYNFDGESTRHILITMGDDFEYMDANHWYTNLDKLIHYANEDGRLNVFYSTPQVYTKSRYDQHRSWAAAVTKNNLDWFPYGQGRATIDANGRVIVTESHAVWTGYFTSRPKLKKIVRISSAVLELCRIAEVVGSVPNSSDAFSGPSRKLWEALSVAQHHDAVSGTSRHRVADDYDLMLREGIRQCGKYIGSSGLFDTSDPSSRATVRQPFYWSLVSSMRGAVVGWNSILDTQRNDAGLYDGFEVYFAYYRATKAGGQASGAYVFRPDCPEGDVPACVPTRIDLASTPWVSMKIVDGNRVEWSVGPIPKDYEIVLVFKAPWIKNSGTFYTDSNGYKWMERRLNKRVAGYNLTVTDPVSGNYYPVSGGIGIRQGVDSSLVVIPDRAVGGTSLRDGEIEIMVHRRLTRDDAKGLDEALDELQPDTRDGIVVGGVTYFDFSGKYMSLTNSFDVPRDLLRPPLKLPPTVSGLTWQPLKTSLPSGIAITHFHRVRNDEICMVDERTDCWLVRIIHEGEEGVTIPWKNHLNTARIYKVTEVTANAGKPIADVEKYKWTRDTKELFSSILDGTLKSIVSPGDTRTYIFRVSWGDTGGDEPSDEIHMDTSFGDESHSAYQYSILPIYILLSLICINN